MVGKNLSYTEEIHWEETKERLLTFWKKKLKIGLQLPDKRFTDAFYCQLVHLYMFTVHDDPRISPVSYPLWWLRDGAYVVNALNKGGMHEFSEASCRGIAQKYAFGGFGSEGDAPGEIIWISQTLSVDTGSGIPGGYVSPHKKKGGIFASYAGNR
ncbi:MAG: hypothetical protein ACLVLH_10995 [Eisenbergiella massiliensis]